MYNFYTTLSWWNLRFLYAREYVGMTSRQNGIHTVKGEVIGDSLSNCVKTQKKRSLAKRYIHLRCTQ